MHDAQIPGRPGARLIGREQELRAALELLDGDGDGARGLILAGEPGIGKTAIWRELLARARRRGFQVLAALPSGAEVQLTFAVLGDLVDALGPPALAVLPAPQRRALEVALLRTEGPELDSRAVGVALLAMLRARAAERPLLLAIDDLQWLDGPSARALSFALRRIGRLPVAIAATWRSGEQSKPAPLDLELVLGSDRVTRLEVGPLTLAAIHELLGTRLGLEPPRPTLVALFEAAGGNPFLAIELARELRRRGIRPEPGVPLPVPPSVRQLVAARVERLSPAVRELLLAAAGLARPTIETLGRLAPDAEATLQAAVDAGVIEPGLEHGEVRFTHPLYARVPYEALDADSRRRLHSRLAGALDNLEERARHQALAATRPSLTLARELGRAAGSAGTRGAPARAAELCSLGARLTPPEHSAERGALSLAAAQWHQRAGEIERAAAIAEALLQSAQAAGDTRAQALSLLGTVRADTEGVVSALALYARARRESGASATTRAGVHRRIAWLRLGAGEGTIAGRHARAALCLAAGRDPAGEAGAAAIAALARVMGGTGLPEDLLARAAAPPAAQARSDEWPETAPEIVSAVTLLWAGELERAQPPLQQALAYATERDEPWLAMHALAYLSAIATAAGRPRAGLDHARRYAELAETVQQAPQRAASLWPLAVALAWLGEEQPARAAAGEGQALAQESGHSLYAIGCLGALGVLELSLERFAEAAAVLGRARQLAIGCGVHALGRPPLLPDLVEALALGGDGQAAARLAGEVDRRAAALGSPWALALGWRCAGLVAAASGDHERAIAAFEQALELHAAQDRAPERARTALALGRVLRETRQKRAARDVLEDSAATFDSIGARLWARRARREMARIGGRTTTGPGALSATESQIAELVGGGRTNREVAEILHVSPRTVEWNLSKIYRKLGVRGRTELAASVAIGDRLAKPGGSPG